MSLTVDSDTQAAGSAEAPLDQSASSGLWTAPLRQLGLSLMQTQRLPYPRSQWSVPSTTDSVQRPVVPNGTNLAEPSSSATGPQSYTRGTPESTARLPLRIRQRWQGVVRDVNTDLGIFSAQLTPTDGTSPELLADFSIEDLDADDEALLAEGAPFYLSVGYLMGGRFGKSRVISLRFRRLPRWTQEGIDLAKTRGRERRKALGFDDAP